MVGIGTLKYLAQSDTQRESPFTRIIRTARELWDCSMGVAHRQLSGAYGPLLSTRSMVRPASFLPISSENSRRSPSTCRKQLCRPPYRGTPCCPCQASATKSPPDIVSELQGPCREAPCVDGTGTHFRSTRSRVAGRHDMLSTTGALAHKTGVVRLQLEHNGQLPKTLPANQRRTLDTPHRKATFVLPLNAYVVLSPLKALWLLAAHAVRRGTN